MSHQVLHLHLVPLKDLTIRVSPFKTNKRLKDLVIAFDFNALDRRRVSNAEIDQLLHV